MKLNYDCIRDCLLVLEDKLTLDEELSFSVIYGNEIETALKEKYDFPTIIYSIIKLEEADYIRADVVYTDDCIDFVAVSDITLDGYEFLSSIRPKTVWEKTKQVISKVGTASFSIINQVAAPIMTDFILSQTIF